MLQKDGFFRKRDERREEAKRDDNLFRPTQAVTTAPAAAANAADTEATVPNTMQAGERKEARLVVGLGALEAILVAVHRHPPIGARGFAPQNSCVPSIPMRCTSTMFRTMDLAVAVPTPTGPPLAL